MCCPIAIDAADDAADYHGNADGDGDDDDDWCGRCCACAQSRQQQPCTNN